RLETVKRNRDVLDSQQWFGHSAPPASSAGAGLGFFLVCPWGVAYVARERNLARSGFPGLESACRPLRPWGKIITTPTNRDPMTKSHSSGIALLIQSLPKLTSNVPSTAPSRLLRPPTATQITISMEATTPIIAGEMTPTCNVNSAPPLPRTPRRQQTLRS